MCFFLRRTHFLRGALLSAQLVAAKALKAFQDWEAVKVGKLKFARRSEKHVADYWSWMCVFVRGLERETLT